MNGVVFIILLLVGLPLAIIGLGEILDRIRMNPVIPGWLIVLIFSIAAPLLYILGVTFIEDSVELEFVGTVIFIVLGVAVLGGIFAFLRPHLRIGRSSSHDNWGEGGSGGCGDGDD
ncbi:MAG: hypothetical protein V7752_19420 [Halopseudomonas sp.]